MFKKQGQKLSYEEFAKRAILRLRRLPFSYGIHSAYSGFNNAFDEYFGVDPSPLSVLRILAEQGKIEIIPAKKGVLMYLPGEAPPRDLHEEALSIILA